LTQEELAERIGDGVRQAEVSRLECDRVSLPRRQRLSRIAAALDLSVGELLASAGWAGADVALREAEPFNGDSSWLSPTRTLPHVPAPGIKPELDELNVRGRAEASANLWAAIERSRMLQQRTADLLEACAAVAAKWWEGQSARSRPHG
jgi:transcriptional regulator with XRE-family HTH domain